MNELLFGNTQETLPIMVFLFIIVLIVWSFVWKGRALWQSARNGDTRWFIFFLLVNTIGIVEILYIKFLSKSETTKKNV